MPSLASPTGMVVQPLEDWKFMVIASYAVRWRQSGKSLPP